MEKKWYNQSDIVLGVGVIAILAMLIVPLPGFLLDLLIVVSLALGLIILLTSLSVKEPSDFSIFPNLLLISTLYRLALNVSTTRQILSQGASFNSHIIDAFGTFVVGGGTGLSKYVVGFIIFLILTIVQILVITKGATRISEVAARFTLDALPGKQMAIDTELSSGNISEEEAKFRRKKIQREVDFYGAMDGASKFVQGDVRAGLIITAINLLGGVIIGTSIRGESFMSAIETYGKFTIGDGLVSQIPGLLSTTATGMIVTRAGSEQSLAQEFKQQLFGNAKTLYVVSGSLALASFIPGLPFFSLNFFAFIFSYLAYIIDKNTKEAIANIEKKDADAKTEKKPDYYKELRTDPIEVELGLNLVPLVDVNQGGVLLDQISNLRRRFAIDTGLVIPAVRILDNLELHPDSYAIKIHGVIVGESKIKPEKLMALDSSKKVSDPIRGEEFVEPTFGYKAKWIDPADKIEAENRGYTVVDSSTVIVTHLKELIANHASGLLGREEVKNLLEHQKSTHPTLIAELEEKKIGIGLIQQVLQNLLKEGLGIRSLSGILEAIANNESRSRDPFFLSENVRQAISRQITNDYVSQFDGKLHVITLDPRVSERLSKGVVVDPIEGSLISIPPDYYNKLIESCAKEYNRCHSEGKFPIFVVSRPIRLPFSYMLAKEFPPRNFAVIAIEEIHSSAKTVMDAVINVTYAEPTRTGGTAARGGFE